MRLPRVIRKGPLRIRIRKMSVVLIKKPIFKYVKMGGLIHEFEIHTR